MHSGKSSPKSRRRSDDIWAQQQVESLMAFTGRKNRNDRDDNDTTTVSLPEMIDFDEIDEAQMIIRRDRITHYSEVGEKLRTMRKKRQGWDCSLVCEKVTIMLNEKQSIRALICQKHALSEALAEYIAHARRSVHNAHGGTRLRPVCTLQFEMIFAIALSLESAMCQKF